MSDELAIVLLASKPLMYGWLLAIPRLWIPPERRPSRWRPVWGAGLRTLLGFAIGLPAALLTFRLGAAVSIAALSAARILIWFLCFRLCYPALSGWKLLGFSVGCTALNWILDLTLWGGWWGNANFGLC